MPGVWLLDETYDYDAASQNFATHAAEARRQESGSAPGIRVTVTTTPGSPKRPRARGGPASPTSDSSSFAAPGSPPKKATASEAPPPPATPQGDPPSAGRLPGGQG